MAFSVGSGESSSAEQRSEEEAAKEITSTSTTGQYVNERTSPEEVRVGANILPQVISLKDLLPSEMTFVRRSSRSIELEEQSNEVAEEQSTEEQSSQNTETEEQSSSQLSTERSPSGQLSTDRSSSEGKNTEQSTSEEKSMERSTDRSSSEGDSEKRSRQETESELSSTHETDEQLADEQSLQEEEPEEQPSQAVQPEEQSAQKVEPEEQPAADIESEEPVSTVESSESWEPAYEKRKKQRRVKRQPKLREKSVESRSKMAPFLPEKQLWSWADGPYRRVGAKGRFKKQFHRAIGRRDETIEVGDSAVFLSTSSADRPYIGQIMSMWETSNASMIVKVKWYYHPEERKGSPENLKYPVIFLKVKSQSVYR